MDDASREQLDEELNPYSCLAKRLNKIAGLTEEVYLANLGGTRLSPSFKDFTSLSVLWLSDNQLQSLDNIDACFRIREIYVQNNKLLSLSFLPKLKFLEVLFASNNPIKNLDKQITLLTRAAFLKTLDLSDNPVADEPDYRLRIIYNVPQVNILDRRQVTLQQQLKAAEVVPTLDKVSVGPPAKSLKKASSNTVLEVDCFRSAKLLRDRRSKAADDALRTQVFLRSASLGVIAPRPQHLIEGTERWSNPSYRIEQELLRPSPWEQAEISTLIEQLVFPKPLVVEEEVDAKGKKKPDKKGEPIPDPSENQTVGFKDVVELSGRLASQGLEEVGRVLVSPDVFAPLPASPRESAANWRQTRKNDKLSSGGTTKPHPLDKLIADPDAVMPLKEVVKYLLSLQWRRFEDHELEHKIGRHYAAAMRAHMQGGEDATAADDVSRHRSAALRLEGEKTRKGGVSVFIRTPPPAPIPRTRSDVFTHSLLRPSWIVDENTGRRVLQVSQERQTNTLKMH